MINHDENREAKVQLLCKKIYRETPPCCNGLYREREEYSCPFCGEGIYEEDLEHFYDAEGCWFHEEIVMADFNHKPSCAWLIAKDLYTGDKED